MYHSVTSLFNDALSTAKVVQMILLHDCCEQWNGKGPWHI